MTALEEIIQYLKTLNPEELKEAKEFIASWLSER